jgi:hypothetical protein
MMIVKPISINICMQLDYVLKILWMLLDKEIYNNTQLLFISINYHFKFNHDFVFDIYPFIYFYNSNNF